MRQLASLIALVLGAVAPAVHAQSGFIGMGIEFSRPSCAYACSSVIAMAMIDCPDSEDHMDGMEELDSMDSMNHTDHMDMRKRHGDGMEDVTPECRAQSMPFLTTLAYCINQTCPEEITLADRQAFWASQATGGDAAPSMSYEMALHMVNGTPAIEYSDEDMLNQTAITPHDAWLVQYTTLDNFANLEAGHVRYGLALLLVGFSLPILATLFGHLPYAHRILTNINPYLIYPAAIGKRHVQTVLAVCNPPTLGQSWYIFLFIGLNIILTSVGFHSVQPNAWYTSTRQEITSLIGGRTGVLAMALAPLVLLFGGRNNILLWLANWDHSTYMLLHRWVARVFTVQVILHSVTELAVYVDNGSYDAEYSQAWWVWGCVATVACVAMCIQGVLRKYAYEFFIALHVILAIFVTAGTWYHLIYRFDYQYGYHVWMYLWFAVWAFDRFMRIAWIVKSGWCTARVRRLGDEVTRVDISKVRWSAKPGQHAYVYFPSINEWSPWQAHPFSVVPTQFLRRRTVEAASEDDHEKALSPSTSHDLASLPSVASKHMHSTAGITFYIKGKKGLTRRLLRSFNSIYCLVEGPYGGGHEIILSCDRVVILAGGIGITATLPYTLSHLNTKLYWSVRQPMAPLVEDIQPSLNPAMERDVRIGSRFDVHQVIANEAATGWKTLGVVVCGPPSMCDDVRAAVVDISKGTGAKIELKVDAFSW